MSMEELKDVVVDPSPTEEEVVKQEGELDASQDTTPDEDQVNEEETGENNSQPQGDVDFTQFDENGVPWKNRAMEAQRKYGELAQSLPQLIEETITKATSKKTEQTYTIAQLEAYAQENPEYRGWAEEEKAKIQRAEYAKLIDEKLNAGKKEQEVERQRQMAYRYVYNTYPEAFTKTPNGQVVFNLQSPLVKEIDQLMRDPELAQSPRGLMMAADSAYAKLTRANSGKNAVKVKTLASKLKKEQRKGLVEGGTDNVVQQSPARKALDRLSQTGTKKDAANAIAEILKFKGVLQ